MAQVFHPALGQLMRHQMQGRLRRAWQTVTSPRRLMLTVISLTLAAVWLGNTLAAMLLREPFSPTEFQDYISLGLLAYAGWHFIRIAWTRPEQPIEWSEAEQEFLTPAPLSDTQLTLYRMANILSSTTIKALLFSVVMLPDLPVWFFGFSGFLLGLLLIEMLRLFLDIIAWGVSRRHYLWLRGGILTAGGLLLAVVVTRGLQNLPASDGKTPTFLILLQAAREQINWLRAQPLGQWLEFPFASLSQIIAGVGAPLEIGLRFAGGLGLVGGLAVTVVHLHGWFRQRSIAREQAEFRQLAASGTHTFLKSADKIPGRIPRVPTLGGIGPVFWRQGLAAWRHRTAVLVAMIFPTILSLLPLLIVVNPFEALVNVVGSLVFFTFLLLPAAFKFDFRGDYSHFIKLKMLPISPTALTLGQLACPTLLATGFQAAALFLTQLYLQCPPGWIVVSLSLLLPLNMLIFTLENQIYLLSPYRIKEEGMQVFLRTILVFTGKGLLFTMAAMAVYAWAVVAPTIRLPELEPALLITLRRTIFLGGIGLMTSSWVAVAFAALIRTWRNFNPILDAGE